jgi:hypothetical protein
VLVAHLAQQQVDDGAARDQRDHGRQDHGEKGGGTHVQVQILAARDRYLASMIRAKRRACRTVDFVQCRI